MRLLALLLLLLGAPVFAAVTPNSAVTPQTPKRPIVQFLQGTDTAGTYKTLITAGTNGTKCIGIVLTTSDATATHLVTVQIVRATVKYGGTAITTTLGAGFTTGIPPIDVMSLANWPGLPRDSDNNPFFLLESGDTIQATYATALTSTTVINLAAVCADF